MQEEEASQELYQVWENAKVPSQKRATNMEDAPDVQNMEDAPAVQSLTDMAPCTAKKTPPRKLIARKLKIK